MFKLDSNTIKQSKKNYTKSLKNNNFEAYKIHEKINVNLNHSVQTNATEETSTKTTTTKNLLSNSNFNNNKTKQKNSIQKCSYLKFLELRKPKNPYPLGSTEKRFKWQNLKDENIVIYPEIYKKPHKKQNLLKETFGEGILGFLNNRQDNNNRKGRNKIRRCKSENVAHTISYRPNDDIEITRRVIIPESNKEKAKISRRRANSQSKVIYHKTTGNIKSLFELTPIDIPIKGKKLFKSKSYGCLTINIFDENYSQYEKPTNTKKLFLDNKCFYDNLKANNIIHNMNECWRNQRKKSVEHSLSSYAINMHLNLSKLNLRNYNYNPNYRLNKTCIINKSFDNNKRSFKN